MSEKPGSTIGFERRFNRLLRIQDEEDFVCALTGDLAPQPPNFERIVELNRGPLLTEPMSLEPLAPERVNDVLKAGATLVDGRGTREFDAEHIPGSLNVSMLYGAVGTRAAWVVDSESDVAVTAATDAEARRLGGLLAVACSAGNRSSIAASLLKRAGVDDIVHVAEGGIADLAGKGVELVGGP